MLNFSLEELIQDPKISWYFQEYIPMPKESLHDLPHKTIYNDKGEKYRLSKLMSDSYGRTAHYIVASSHIIELVVSEHKADICLICRKRRKGAIIGTGELTFHKKCLPAFLDYQLAVDLLALGHKIGKSKTGSAK